MVSENSRKEKLDSILINWMARHCITALRYSVGIVYLWFGVVKFFPEFNPSHDLSYHTIDAFTFGWLGEKEKIISMYILGGVEVAIGLGLISGKLVRIVLALLLFQLLGTILCFAEFYDEIFRRPPHMPTLEAQLLIKNLVLIGAGMVIGATIRGRAIVTNEKMIGKI